MSKPKVLFVFDHKDEKRWMDGLWAALNLLEEDFEIEKLNLAQQTILDRDVDYDFVLGWGAFGSSVDYELQNAFFEQKMGLCIAGNAIPPEGALNYDVLFYETKWYRPQIDFHPNIVQAFGVNTDIFSEIDIPTPIVWDYIGVGALAKWKRWEKMIDKPGNKLVVGEYQLGNEAESSQIAVDLLKGGVMISPLVNPYDLAMLYHYSRASYVSADLYGGGERTVLESRACGLDVIIEDDNPKLKEVLDWNPIPDHHWYAAQLKKGILSCL